jgi:hypothetical protein
MIFDHRTYTCRPGTINKQIALYQSSGWEAQTRNLGQPLLYAVTETGDVNAYVHVWVYEDAADRQSKRAALMADPDWLAYLALSAEAGYLISQANTILTTVPFFTPKT